MLDIVQLRKDLPAVIAGLKKRKPEQPFLDEAAFVALETERKALQTRTEELQAQRNSLSKQIGAAKSKGENADAILAAPGSQAMAQTTERIIAIGTSTGGTQAFIENEGVPVVAVETLTSYPSILGGRVKTLHPKVFGGILARRDNQSDAAQLETYEIPEIDLVIVDLYPFEETVAQTDDEAEIIEKIDIGGVSLIRAAAKNYNDVVIVAARNYYGELLALLREKQGFTAQEDRRLFAARAFDTCSHYDTQIFKYLSVGQGSLPPVEFFFTSSPKGEKPKNGGGVPAVRVIPVVGIPFGSSSAK